MLKSLLVLALGLALGLLASWMWKMSTGGAPAVLAGPEFVLRADLARSTNTLMDQIADLRKRIEEMAARPQTETMQREPVVVPSASVSNEQRGEADVIAISPAKDLDTRLGRLEQELLALTHSIDTHRGVATYPKVEELRAARKTIDWNLIAQVSTAMKLEHEAGLALVRYLTIPEILERFGAPTTIDFGGNWYYQRRQGETFGPEGFELNFVNGYVVGVQSTDE